VPSFNNQGSEILMSHILKGIYGDKAWETVQLLIYSVDYRNYGNSHILWFPQNLKVADTLRLSKPTRDL
jgi:hypothetical protein